MTISDNDAEVRSESLVLLVCRRIILPAVVSIQQCTGTRLCVQQLAVVGPGVKFLLIDVLSFGKKKYPLLISQKMEGEKSSVGIISNLTNAIL